MTAAPTAGTVLAGIIGAILAVPLTAVTRADIKAWNAEAHNDITRDQILQAEMHTLMDEQGHGPSTMPDYDPAAAAPELPDVDAALLVERSLVASRQQA